MSTSTVVIPRTRVDRRTAGWARRFGLPVTPLLVRRFAARKRAMWVSVPFAVLGLALAGINFADVITDPDQARRGMTVAAVICGALFPVALVLGAVAGLERQARAEQRIAEDLPDRVTRPEPVRVALVLGRVQLAVFLLAYPGMVAYWTVVVLLRAEDRPELTVGWAVVGALTLLTLVVAVGLARVVRRPAVAEDGSSLAADDELRTGDARTLILPVYPMLVVLLTSTRAVSLDLLLPALAAMGLLVVLAVVHGVGMLRGVRTRAPVPR